MKCPDGKSTNTTTRQKNPIVLTAKYTVEYDEIVPVKLSEREREKYRSKKRTHANQSNIVNGARRPLIVICITPIQLFNSVQNN